MIYNKYSLYLAQKYGEKVYKLPVNLPLTCPNRDGMVGIGGCTYCGEIGAGFENWPGSFCVSHQLNLNREKIKKKYKAHKFIAYFQNYSNTYLPLNQLKCYLEQSLQPDIVEIALSTRPDCIRDDYLEFLHCFARKNKIEISLELGLQTANYHTLAKINRGHGLAEFIDAILRVKKYGMTVCAHVIPNLPGDTDKDAVETSKILSVLGVNQVKLHALYIVKGSSIEKDYLTHKIQMCSLQEYKERVMLFLEYLCPDITVQRIIGRVPEKDAVFANWNTSWWKIRDDIEEEMEKNNRFQGKYFNYTNGAALKKFPPENVR